MTNQYKEYLQSPEWAFRRDKCMDRSSYRCEGCGTTRRLQAHHLTYERLYNEAENDLISLCMICHELAHRGKDAGFIKRAGDVRNLRLQTLEFIGRFRITEPGKAPVKPAKVKIKPKKDKVSPSYAYMMERHKARLAARAKRNAFRTDLCNAVGFMEALSKTDSLQSLCKWTRRNLGKTGPPLAQINANAAVIYRVWKAKDVKGLIRNGVPKSMIPYEWGN